MEDESRSEGCSKTDKGKKNERTNERRDGQTGSIKE